MSIWVALQSWLEKLASAPKAGPLAADLQIFDAAMAATIHAAQGIKAGTLSPVDALGALDLQLKAIAIVYPPAALAESYVEAAQAVAQVAMDLGVLKTDPGLPYKGDGINPNTGEAIGV